MDAGSTLRNRACLNREGNRNATLSILGDGSWIRTDDLRAAGTESFYKHTIFMII